MKIDYLWNSNFTNKKEIIQSVLFDFSFQTDRSCIDEIKNLVEKHKHKHKYIYSSII